MRLWISREGLDGSLGLARPLRQYVVALLAPLGVVALVGLMIVVTGVGQRSAPAEPLTFAILILLPLLLIPEMVLSVGEEYGWRGYLLPRLIALGEVRASLLLGLVWGLWHLPVVMAGVLLGGHALWLVAPLHVGVVLLSAFPYTWLAKVSDYSPAVASVFHGSTNWVQQRLFGFLVLGNLLAGIAMLGLGWLLVVLAVYGLRRLRPRPLMSAST